MNGRFAFVRSPPATGRRAGGARDGTARNTNSARANLSEVAIYALWLKALDGHSAEAVKSLEEMLEKAGKRTDETTAEAADVLAMLYMAGGEGEKAKKAVNFGLKALQYQGVKDGYVLALLRGRLKSDIAAGEAKRAYDQAENSAARKKFVEAGQLFAQVRAAYPTNEWGHASGFRIGQCYAGLDAHRPGRRLVAEGLRQGVARRTVARAGGGGAGGCRAGATRPQEGH